MKRLYSIFFILLCTALSVDAQRINVIPQPEKVTEQSGEFTLNADTRLSVSDASLMPVAKVLYAKLRQVTAFDNQIVGAKRDANVVEFRKQKSLPSEAYTLSVTAHKIVISSSTPNGAFYGVQTLYQLLPRDIFGTSKSSVRWTVPCCTIEDAPRFSYRGMHLDVCSHFFGPEYIKRYLDLMAMHKLNVFHWHLTEDQGWRIEIKKYPLLTEKGSVRSETVIGSWKSKVYDGKPYGGFYTQEQIKDIVKYAADRYITVIPEIEMPGHSLAAISCYPSLSCGLEKEYKVATRWGVFPQVYCPKDETFTFLENVLSEVFTLFPSRLIHIGGDECPKSSWKRCPHCQQMIKDLGLKDEFQLQSYFIQRIEKFVNSKGRQIIGWDEILQGGLAPNATVMSWLGEAGGIKAARQHHNVVMCPYQKYYLDYYQADPRTEKLAQPDWVPLKMVYDYNPVPDSLTRDEQKYILGVQGCVWTEYLPTPERVEYMAYPRMLAICESGWSSADRKDWNSFTRRLEYHLGRLDELKVPYCKAFYDVSIHVSNDSQYSKVATLSIDAPDAEIHYTTDGTAPSASSPLYKMPFVINPSQVVCAAGFRHGQMIGKVVSRGFN